MPQAETQDPYNWLEKILKREQEYVQQCTLANIEAARTTGQWIIHDPNRAEAKRQIISEFERVKKEAEQKPVGSALEIDVPSETMQFVLSATKLLPTTISKRVLEPQWLVDKWFDGTGDKYDYQVEQWKLQILASLAKYNWSIFLLKPENIPRLSRGHIYVAKD